VFDKKMPNKMKEILLVVDATQGQNVVQQVLVAVSVAGSVAVSVAVSIEVGVASMQHWDSLWCNM